MTTLEKVKVQAASHQRVMIRPRVEVDARTSEQRKQVSEIARNVIQNHYAVLLALKNR